MVYPAAHGAGRARAAGQSGLARRLPADRRRCARILQTTPTVVQSTAIQRFGSAADRMTEFDPTTLRAASARIGGFMDNSTPPRCRASNTRPIRRNPRPPCRTAGHDAGFHEDTPCLARPIRRFVLRAGRIGPGQTRALDEFGRCYGAPWRCATGGGASSAKAREET